MAAEPRPVRRALVSVYDKAGVESLAAGLHEAGVEIISTGSTGERIRAAGTPVRDVADVTGFPECLDGRVKTLHPAVHAGLLADRDEPAHLEELDELGVEPIDLVVVNLYPFEEAVAAGRPADEIVEMIDIGGPTLLRAAAKNHAAVGVVVDPADYDDVRAAVADGGLGVAHRRRLATKAFAHVTRYDAAISSWFQSSDGPLPATLGLALDRRRQLRYGENPHQRGALYTPAGPPAGLGAAEQLHGKELSYNNLVDTDAAMAMVAEFDRPAAAVIKHTNPAGAAVAGDLATAHERALAGDPVSAFGGIVAANRPVDGDTARQIAEVFTEVVVAPDFTEDALAVLTEKSSLRLLRVDGLAPEAGSLELASVHGGVLVQEVDAGAEPFDDWEVPTEARPDEDTLAELRFAWIAAKHVKSNAIVLTSDHAVVGTGAGQMSRVDAVELAIDKSRDRHDGAVLASDAFFPFRDGPDRAAEAGIRAIVQPGGSIRDDEVIEAADEHGIPMVMTGRRHFRHH